MVRTAAVLGGTSHHLCTAGLAKVESGSDTAAIVVVISWLPSVLCLGPIQGCFSGGEFCRSNLKG